MFGIENIIVFIGSGIVLNLYPGPDTLYIIGRSVSQGRGAGVSAALGIGTGGIVHTLLGAFGLSAVISTSPTRLPCSNSQGAVISCIRGRCFSSVLPSAA